MAFCPKCGSEVVDLSYGFDMKSVELQCFKIGCDWYGKIILYNEEPL